MPKIAFIGAGSTIFAKRLMGDILLFPELSDVTFSLHDIDETRLKDIRNCRAQGCGDAQC